MPTSSYRKGIQDVKKHSHAAQRASQRLNLNLTPKYYTQIRNDIMQGVATLIEEQEHPRQKWEVFINGSLWTVIWDKQRTKIITIW